MCADGWQRMRRVGRASAIAMTLLTAVGLGSCRTTGATGTVDSAPAVAAEARSAEAAEIGALPDGSAKDLVASRCLLCHGAGLIAQQRKDSAAWGRTVTQMRTWGTPIQDDDQTAIVAYLVEHFGPSAQR
jgi:cytochrome c5